MLSSRVARKASASCTGGGGVINCTADIGSGVGATGGGGVIVGATGGGGVIVGATGGGGVIVGATGGGGVIVGATGGGGVIVGATGGGGVIVGATGGGGGAYNVLGSAVSITGALLSASINALDIDSVTDATDSGVVIVGCTITASTIGSFAGLLLRVETVSRASSAFLGSCAVTDGVMPSVFSDTDA